jgi:hypothetical protein
MARHEARVEHVPDMRSPGLFKSNAPQGIGEWRQTMIYASKRIFDTDGVGVVTSTLLHHHPSIHPSRPITLRKEDGTNGGWAQLSHTQKLLFACKGKQRTCRTHQ